MVRGGGIEGRTSDSGFVVGRMEEGPWTMRGRAEVAARRRGRRSGRGRVVLIVDSGRGNCRGEVGG
jgi:hypothetical protein